MIRTKSGNYLIYYRNVPHVSVNKFKLKRMLIDPLYYFYNKQYFPVNEYEKDLTDNWKTFIWKLNLEIICSE